LRATSSIRRSGAPTDHAPTIRHRGFKAGPQAIYALRHGLTAETVIDGLEDTEDYRGFEATITSDYNAKTAVERGLVLRLASLLWRRR
jgi:hypothetical protein